MWNCGWNGSDGNPLGTAFRAAVGGPFHQGSDSELMSGVAVKNR